MSDRAVGSTGNKATIRIYTSAGVPAPSLALHSTGTVIQYKPEGGTPVTITLTGSPTPNYVDRADGYYEVNVPDAAYTSAVPRLTIGGSLAGHVIIEAIHQVRAPYLTDKTGYSLATPPPTASANASAVRTELATELGRIDAQVSSRLATSGYTSPPTAAANASQVRTELTPELARIDVETSTRLAASAYTAPPSISGLASQASVDGIGNRLPSTLDGGLIRAKVESESAGLAKEATVNAVGQAVVVVGNNTTALLNRIPQDIFTGITRLARWLGILAGKTADSATLTEIQATTGGAGFNNTTDSLEAIRDRGDVAWIGGAGNGEFQLTITVSDGTTGVANCRVSLVGTGLFAFTNTNGVSPPFNVAGSATYTVRVTPPATFDAPSDTSVVVAAQNVSQTIVVTAKPPVNPSAAPQCNVVLPVTDGAGSALTGAKVSIEFIRFESGATPSSVVIPPVPELTSAAGVVTVPLLRFGRYRATYSYQDGIKDFEFVVPDSGSATIVEQV
jgi:hypothetical protein